MIADPYEVLRSICEALRNIYIDEDILLQYMVQNKILVEVATLYLAHIAISTSNFITVNFIIRI